MKEHSGRQSALVVETSVNLGKNLFSHQLWKIRGLEVIESKGIETNIMFLLNVKSFRKKKITN